MPYVSQFYGIIIRMFFNEHNPPHFHAEYQGFEAEFDFDGEMLRGSIKSKNAKYLIKEWALLHKFELEDNWYNIEHQMIINKISPLD